MVLLITVKNGKTGLNVKKQKTELTNYERIMHTIHDYIATKKDGAEE
jgi:hypothetical protein